MAKWFLANFLVSMQGKKIAGPVHHPVQPVGPSDRVLDLTLDSEVARSLFSLRRELVSVADTLSPDGNPDYDRALDELREYGVVTFRLFRSKMEEKLPSGILQPGEHVEVRRQWALVAVKDNKTPQVLPGNKPDETEGGNPLTSILIIVKHLKILQGLLGPNLQTFRDVIRGMQ